MTLLSLFLLPTVVKSFLHLLSLLYKTILILPFPWTASRLVFGWYFFVILMADNMDKELAVDLIFQFFENQWVRNLPNRKGHYSLWLWSLQARTPYSMPTRSSHTFLRRCLENERVSGGFAHYYGTPQASLHSIMPLSKTAFLPTQQCHLLDPCSHYTSNLLLVSLINIW